MSARVAAVEMDGLERLLRESAGTDLLYVLLREQGRPVGRVLTMGRSRETWQTPEPSECES